MLNTFRAADQANSGAGASGCGVAVVIRLQRGNRKGEQGNRGTENSRLRALFKGWSDCRPVNSTCNWNVCGGFSFSARSSSPPCPSRRFLLLFPVLELSKYNHCYRSSGLTVWECCQRVAIDVILKGLSLSPSLFLTIFLFRSLLMHINVNINVNICASNDRCAAVGGFVRLFSPADDDDDVWCASCQRQQRRAALTTSSPSSTAYSVIRIVSTLKRARNLPPQPALPPRDRVSSPNDAL